MNPKNITLNPSVPLKQNYKSTPTTLLKVIDLVKLDKEKFASQKNEIKIIKSENNYVSNEKKAMINIQTSLRKNGTKSEKNKERISKDDENTTTREFKTDIINTLKKNMFSPKNIKTYKKVENLTHTIILTTNCTDTNKDSRSINLDQYHNNKPNEEYCNTLNEESKQNNFIDFNQDKIILSNDPKEINILLSIQNFNNLIRLGNSKSKVDENHQDIQKLNSLIKGLKTGDNDSNVISDNTIKQNVLVGEDSNKKLGLRDSLFSTIKRENLITGIYLNSDMRIKKYGIFFEFFSDNIKEINNYLRPTEQVKENENFSPLSTLRIIEKTLSNLDINKPTSNVVSDISIFNETEKNDKILVNRCSTNKLSIKDISQCDFDGSDMQENAVVNKPVDLSLNKIKIKTENYQNMINNYNDFKDNISLVKMNSFEKNNSLFDIIDKESINSEFCKNGKVYDDDNILKNLDFDLQSNASSLKNVSKFFKLATLRNEYIEEGKDNNKTILINDSQGNEKERKISLKNKNQFKKQISIPSLDKTFKMDQYEQPNNDQTVIHNHFDDIKDNKLNPVGKEKIHK